MHFPSALALLILAASAWSAGAAPAPPPVRAEIETMLKALRNSGCQFNRNGSWYTGAEAQSHLSKKFEYLEGKSLVNSAEDFISLGASTSSSSGKPYLVRCGSSQPVESKVWLQEQLKTIRLPK
jgi:Family of unknown function (DUF5329)